MAYIMISCIEVADITQTLKIAELHLETSLRRIWHETFLGSRIIFLTPPLDHVLPPSPDFGQE